MPDLAPTLKPATVQVRQEVSARIAQVDAKDGFRSLDPESVDLVCTSPPYWGQRTYGQDHDPAILDRWREETSEPTAIPSYDWYRSRRGVLGMEPYPEWFISNLVEIFAAARRALKPGANLWVNLGDTYFGRWSSIRPGGRQGMAGEERVRRRTPSGGWLHDKQLMLLPARFAIAMQTDGWILRNDVIWSKPHVAPRPERDRLRLSHEHFFHFVQRSKGTRPTYYYDLEQAENGRRDVVTVASSNGKTDHPAMFPPALVKPRILTSSPPNGTVVDPFCGSGTTLTCALESGRSAIGFDVSARYLEIAQRELCKLDASESSTR